MYNIIRNIPCRKFVIIVWPKVNYHNLFKEACKLAYGPNCITDSDPMTIEMGHATDAALVENRQLSSNYQIAG